MSYKEVLAAVSQLVRWHTCHSAAARPSSGRDPALHSHCQSGEPPSHTAACQGRPSYAMSTQAHVQLKGMLSKRHLQVAVDAIPCRPIDWRSLLWAKGAVWPDRVGGHNMTWQFHCLPAGQLAEGQWRGQGRHCGHLHAHGVRAPHGHASLCSHRCSALRRVCGVFVGLPGGAHRERQV